MTDLIISDPDKITIRDKVALQCLVGVIAGGNHGTGSTAIEAAYMAADAFLAYINSLDH